MDNFSETSKKTGRFINQDKRPKSDQRWTLLFIGNHGRTITLRRFKGMVLLTVFVLCIAIAITVGLLFLSLNIRQEKVQLESRMNDLKEQIKTLRYEKDVLMTRLVLAEARSKVGTGTDKIPPKQEEPDSAGQAEREIEQPKQTPEQTATQEATPALVRNEPEVTADQSDEAADQSDAELSVVLENFQISPKPDENLLRVQFKIKNTSANSQHVSGHTVMVLKGDQISQDRWMAIPSMPLVDGKPTGKQRGYAFGINYFKSMRFSSNYPKSPEDYQVATVYVFTRKGELLVEKDYPVSLPTTSRAVPAEAPSSETTPPAKPPATSSAMPPSADESINTDQNTTPP
jgi:hypothetical protein